MAETHLNDDDHALIRQLCTRAGIIMEDASVEALLWDGGVDMLDGLAASAAKAQAILAAARAIARTSA